MKMKIVSALLAFSMLLGTTAVMAEYEYPDAFWGPNGNYETALNSDNKNDIITYGKQIIDVMKNEPDTPEKRNVMVTRYNQIALAYSALGDYENSAKTFDEMYGYISQFGNDYYDYLKVSKARSNQYTPQIKMYTDRGTPTYYGAKNENKNGVLFGICADGGTKDLLNNNSMVLIYHEVGYGISDYNRIVFEKAAERNRAVEYALNCPNLGSDIRNIRSKEADLQEISDMFSQYPQMPVYLRFAAEFDIWGDMPSPEEFKDAFKYVSDYFKSRNQNVAMVWSPNQVSNWNTNIDDYYPGDEYVDWVGMSLYAQMYFLGDPNQSEENQIVFKTGINSNPVIAVKDIVEKYGNRKPIMLSESGCGHTLTQLGVNATDFALKRLREYYLNLPMVYPQIKLIAYFDKYLPHLNEKNDYSLSSNKTIQNEYLKLTETPRFIQDNCKNNVELCYRGVENGTNVDGVFMLSCYAHRYNNTAKKVTYYIDNNYVGSATEIPFTAYIDAGKYSGNRTLKAVAEFADGKTLVSEAAVTINSSNRNLSVEIDGKKIVFDQNPIIYNDRTMVPMRKIFEELGADVSWNGDTKTATGKKGGKTVEITVGKSFMKVDGEKIMLDTAPIILEGRTLVPARAIAESMGCKVNWDGANSTVGITP